jgi:hypothetical protein
LGIYEGDRRLHRLKNHLIKKKIIFIGYLNCVIPHFFNFILLVGNKCGLLEYMFS